MTKMEGLGQEEDKGRLGEDGAGGQNQEKTLDSPQSGSDCALIPPGLCNGLILPLLSHQRPGGPDQSSEPCHSLPNFFTSLEGRFLPCLQGLPGALGTAERLSISGKGGMGTRIHLPLDVGLREGLEQVWVGVRIGRGP